MLLLITKDNQQKLKIVIIFMEISLMRKSVLFVTVIVLLVTVLPVVADGGHDDVAAGVVATSSNVTLLGVSGLLTFLTVGIVRQVTVLKSWTFWQWGIVGLTALSAFIHLGFGLRGDTLLLLNGLGYIGLLALLVAPVAFLAGYQQWVRGLLLVYTAVTFIGYFALHTPAAYSNTGLLTKAIELGLMVCVGVQLWQANGRLATNKTKGALAK